MSLYRIVALSTAAALVLPLQANPTDSAGPGGVARVAELEAQLEVQLEKARRAQEEAEAARLRHHARAEAVDARAELLAEKEAALRADIGPAAHDKFAHVLRSDAAEKSIQIEAGGVVKLDPLPKLDFSQAFGEGRAGLTEWSRSPLVLWEQIYETSHMLATFDYVGAFEVVNITVTSDSGFSLNVTHGPLRGHNLCLNHLGVDSGHKRPWRSLSWPRRTRDFVIGSLTAAWSSAAADNPWLGLLGAPGPSGEADLHSWQSCSFTVSRAREFAFQVTGDVTVTSEPVVDEMRVLFQLTALVILLNADQIATSFLVYCTSGAFLGSLLLTVVLVVLALKRIDNNRKGVPLVFVAFGGLWKGIGLFWDAYWKYVALLYGLAAVFGWLYCYRACPTITNDAQLQVGLNGVCLLNREPVG